jgi:hypothetical protein
MTTRRRPMVGQCTECGKALEVEGVTVRVYRRRSQHDYRYRLCLPCLGVLHHLLKENSMDDVATMDWWLRNQGARLAAR